jgi:hypothetical protein
MPFTLLMDRSAIVWRPVSAIIAELNERYGKIVVSGDPCRSLRAENRSELCHDLSSPPG